MSQFFGVLTGVSAFCILHSAHQLHVERSWVQYIPSVSELQSVIPRYALVAWILYFFWALVIVLTPDAGLSHALVIVRDLLWEASLLTGLTATCRVAMIIVSSSMLAIKMSDTESTNQLRNFFIALMIVLFVLFIIALALMAAYDLYFYYAAVYLFALGISFLVITAVSWYFLVQLRSHFIARAIVSKSTASNVLERLMPFYWFMLALSICLVAYGCVQLAFATSIARSNALQEYYSRPFPDFNAHLNASIVFCAWITAFVISWKGNLPENGARRGTQSEGEHSATEVSIAPTQDGAAGGGSRGDDGDDDDDDDKLQPVGVGSGAHRTSRASVAPAPEQMSQAGHPMVAPRSAFPEVGSGGH